MMNESDNTLPLLLIREYPVPKSGVIRMIPRKLWMIQNGATRGAVVRMWENPETNQIIIDVKPNGDSQQP